MPHPTLSRARADASNGDYTHPAGGFVCEITSALDYEHDQYVNFTYKIAEGAHEGEYKYACEFRRYYAMDERGTTTQFEKFMRAVEESNPGFDMEAWGHTWNTRQLVGLKFGAVFRERKYTSERGEDRTNVRLYYACSADDIRAGRFKVPDPLDDREQVSTAPTTYEDIVVPF